MLRWRVGSMPLQEGEGYYAKMPAALQQSMDGKGIRKELDALKLGSPGSEAHDFTNYELRICGEMFVVEPLKRSKRFKGFAADISLQICNHH